MAGLVCTVTRRQILPGRPGAQDPKHPIQRWARVAPTSAATIRPLPSLLIPLHEWPNIFPLKVTQISHAFGLLQLPAQSKPLLPRYIGETGSRLYRRIGVGGVARENRSRQDGGRRLWRAHSLGRERSIGRFSPQPEGTGPIFPISASVVARRHPVSVAPLSLTWKKLVLS